MIRFLSFLFILLLSPGVSWAEDAQEDSVAHGHDHADVGFEAVPADLRNLKDAVPWELFNRTTYVVKSVEQGEGLVPLDYLIPTYPEELKALEGQRVRVKGYALPIEGETPFEYVELTPIANAVGGGGCAHYHGPPNLVVEITPRELFPDYLHGVHTFEGILDLPDDPMAQIVHFYYLRDATPVLPQASFPPSDKKTP